MTPAAWEPALLADLDRYLDRLPFHPPRVKPQAVTPNDRACIGYPRKKGGQAAAAQKLAYDELERDYEAARDAFTRAASGTYSEAASFVDHSNTVRNLQSVTLLQRETSTNGTTPEQALEMATRKFQREYFIASVPPIEPCAITELGGKVRVVTLHSVEEVLIARNLTAHWLSQMRRVITTRDILTNSPITLESTENGDLFSADLTAATDYFPHEFTQHVAKRLVEKIGTPPGVTHEIVQRIMGPHQLPDGRITVRGAHMGLGPTWVILCLLNGFAAWYAGAHKDDHRICGDDLIGLWTKSTAERYIHTMKRLGAVVNRSKSFHTEAGVFCERLVLRTGAGTARAYDVGHLAQADAARVKANRTRERLCVAQDLWTEVHFPVLSRETAKSLTPRVRDGGPLRLGGNGRGFANPRQLEACLRFGAVGLVRSPYRLPQGATAKLREAEKEVGDVPISDLLISATTRLRLSDNFRGRKSKEAKPVLARDFIRTTGARRRKCIGTTKSLQEAISASSLSSRDRKTCQWLVNRPQLLSHHGRLKWLQRTVLRPRAQRFVTREFADQWLQSISSVRWELGPRQQLP